MTATVTTRINTPLLGAALGRQARLIAMKEALEARLEEIERIQQERKSEVARISQEVVYASGKVELRESGHVVRFGARGELELLGHVTYALADSQVAKVWKEFLEL